MEQKRTPTWVVVLCVIFGIFMLGGVFYSIGTDAEKKETSTNSNDNKEKVVETNKKKELVLEDGYTAGLDEYGAFYYIEGYVNNSTDKDYNYVSIEFTSYDSEGNTLGTCLDNNSGLEKGGRWKFKAACLENTDKIASVKLKKLSGY